MTFLWSAIAFALFQFGLTFPSPFVPQGASYPAVALGIHGKHDNNTTSATTVVVSGADWASSNATPTAGSAIVCEGKFAIGQTFTSVSDNVNSGAYQVVVPTTKENAHNYYGLIAYKEHVAASPTTITLTYATGATHSQMACTEARNPPPYYAIDSSVVQAKAANSTSPTSGTAVTPYGPGRFIYGMLLFNWSTASAGSGFAYLDNAGTINSTALYPEYQIQTTATATNTPDSIAAAADWLDATVAVAPNTGGYCDATSVVTWDGATVAAGNTVTLTDLQASTHGNNAQPNAVLNNAPGWVIGVAGFKYDTAAYAPFATTLGCPYYAGSGTNAATVGITAATGAGAPSLQEYFTTTQPNVSAITCMGTDLPNTDAGGSTDIFSVQGGHNSGNRDYANIMIYGNGSYLRFQGEFPGGSIDSALHAVSGTKYLTQINYRQAGYHTIQFWTTAGSNCSGTRTLYGTITAGTTVPGGGTADLVSWGPGGASTTTTGYHIWYGPVKWDALYGATNLAW